MSVAVQMFRAEVVTALDELEMQVRRAVEWIQHDRKQHWENEVRRGWQNVAETQVQLQHAMTAKKIAGQEPSCYDEKKAVERAKRRLDIAVKKIERVRHWARAIDQAVNEYRAMRTQLVGWIDMDVPKALAVLDRLSERLEAYVEAAKSSQSPPPMAEPQGKPAERPPTQENPS